MTRDRILDAARQIFTEVGYEAATFQEIARRAGITRPAVNHHFKTKPELFREIIVRTEATMLNLGVRPAFEADTLVGQLSAFVQAATLVESEDRAAAAFLVTSVLESVRRPELRLAEHGPLKTTREFVTWALDSAIERGELNIDTQIAPVVEMIVALVWGMGFYAGFVGNQAQLRVITDQFRALLDGRLWEMSR